MINTAGRESSLIQDLRASLIASTITGEVNVRTCSEALPETFESNELEATDDVEDDSDEPLSELDEADPEEAAA